MLLVQSLDSYAVHLPVDVVGAVSRQLCRLMLLVQSLDSYAVPLPVDVVGAVSRQLCRSFAG